MSDDVIAFEREALTAAVARVREPVHVVRDRHDGAIGVAFDPTLTSAHPERFEWLASLPPLYPEWLGDRGFGEAHGARFPYVVGEMANGIASVELVIAAGRAGLIGFFGAAGLGIGRVAEAIDTIAAALSPARLPWGVNLIHSPNEPAVETRMAELLIAKGVERVCASAFMALTEPVVRLAVAGLTRSPDGRVVRRRHLFAKLSRPEVAEPFMAPAPERMLAALLQKGHITAAEAELAREVPVAEDITVEADSGGHTDNRPLVALLPTIAAQRDAAMRRHGYRRAIRIGAAGGLGTPAGVAAAFALGAAYVVTGSVNQAAVESGMSAAGKQMLAVAGIADVIMAPSSDMFELGVKVQILRRGTLFAQRASLLYDLYRAHGALEEIPEATRASLEKDIFKGSLDAAWASTRAYWEARDAYEVARAEADPKHKMALVFRGYLGLSSRWAITGDAQRQHDYQLWCGPAMGAFNAWVKGTFLEPAAARTCAQIAWNLLEGAAVITRAQQLRTFGVAVPGEAFDFRPRPLAKE